MLILAVAICVGQAGALEPCAQDGGRRLVGRTRRAVGAPSGIALLLSIWAIGCSKIGVTRPRSGGRCSTAE